MKYNNMNTRAIEPRNFWGLVKQVGPWKTTSVDQTHLAQGYDSPHNNVQFVSPYQQDGTATIPDQQYTRKVIIEPHEAEEFRKGKIRKVPRGWDIQSRDGAPAGHPASVFGMQDNPNNIRPNLPDDDVQMDFKREFNVDTTNLIQKMTMEPEKGVSKEFADAQDTVMDENDSGNVTPKMDSNFLSTSNPIVQDIQQVAVSDKQDFRTGVALNAWTQPVNQLSTSHQSSKTTLVDRLPRHDVELADPAKPLKNLNNEKINVKSEREVDAVLSKRIETNRAPAKKNSLPDIDLKMALE